ncbi:MAG TPA: acetate/propionate family kinase [Acidobacteriaceae bacterium]|nr:acetate/propionate family kinase [Acidobacteriaceae bacterium]
MPKPIPPSILVLNGGSSSIKFSAWSLTDEKQKLIEGEIEDIGVEGEGAARFWVKSWLNNHAGEKIIDENPNLEDTTDAFKTIADALNKLGLNHPAAIGHRMVCGGPTVIEHQRITNDLLAEMERYTNFAPLHAPSEIRLMREAIARFPQTPNYVCLDSRFHRDLPAVTRELPIAEEWRAKGLRRFGAHGLSYESLVHHLGDKLPKRVIAAHLGNGASVCAILDGRSLDTSMGLTPTGGILSGSRTGDLDPGVLLYLLRELGHSNPDTANAANALEVAVNKHAGLAGLSSLSNDMRALREAIDKGNQAAHLAVDEFVYVLRKYIGAYAAALGGLDMLIFTGGIGEHDAQTRAELCTGLEFLGVKLDPAKNASAKGEAVISTEDSTIQIQVIPAEEDKMIARHVRRLMRTKP